MLQLDKRDRKWPHPAAVDESDLSCQIVHVHLNRDHQALKLRHVISVFSFHLHYFSKCLCLFVCLFVHRWSCSIKHRPPACPFSSLSLRVNQFTFLFCSSDPFLFPWQHSFTLSSSPSPSLHLSHSQQLLSHVLLTFSRCVIFLYTPNTGV